MHADILVFALVAAFLVYRLYSVLGTKNGSERPRADPFSETILTPPRVADALPVQATTQNPVRVLHPLQGMEKFIHTPSNHDGRIEKGLQEIVAADGTFDLPAFIQGARAAFEYIVKAYARGDLPALKPLVSPKLYQDFHAGVTAREAQGHTSEVILHRIKEARIVEAHLGGTMAYITIDYDVEETAFTKDKTGVVVDGSTDRILTIQDVWSFTRDTRAGDPNWVLIETKAAETV